MIQTDPYNSPVRKQNLQFAYVLILLQTVLGLESGVLMAQDGDQSEADQAGFVEVVDVEIVNIDVWVTDRDGEPVGGLTKEEFKVIRDGEPVEITNFYAVSSGRPVREEAIAIDSPTVDPPGVPGQPPEVAPEHQLWLIVYVDNFNLDPIERNRIIPALEQFLFRTLNQGGKAMIVSYDRFLDVRQPFTDQPALLASALAEIKDDAGVAVVRRREQMEVLNLIDRSESADRAMMNAQLYAESVRSEVDFTVDALDRLVDTLAGLPGRKALIYVSSGIPMTAGEEMFYAVAETFDAPQAYSEIPRHDTSRRFESVSRKANAHRVVFHSMDAGGLRGIEFGAAEYGGFVNPKLRTTLDSVVPENLQAPLRLIARETGGQAILNQNNVGPALDRVIQDLGSFYSLGISSADVDSGRYHEIKVKLKEKSRGIRVRHRAGYRSKSKNARLEESLRSALLYDHEINPLAVEVRWGRAQPYGEKSLFLLPIEIRVPLKEVVLLPMPDDKHEARLRLFVGAAAEDGDISELEETPFGVRIAPENLEAALGESLIYNHKLLVNPGLQKIGIAILDVLGNRSSVISGMVQIGKSQG